MERRVDELGRIVLPRDMREALGIKEKDVLVIRVEGENIVLTRKKTRG